MFWTRVSTSIWNLSLPTLVSQIKFFSPPFKIFSNRHRLRTVIWEIVATQNYRISIYVTSIYLLYQSCFLDLVPGPSVAQVSYNLPKIILNWKMFMLKSKNNKIKSSVMITKQSIFDYRCLFNIIYLRRLIIKILQV